MKANSRKILSFAIALAVMVALAGLLSVSSVVQAHDAGNANANIDRDIRQGP